MSPPTQKPAAIPQLTPTAEPQKFFTEEFDASSNLGNWEQFSLGAGGDTDLSIG